MALSSNFNTNFSAHPKYFLLSQRFYSVIIDKINSKSLCIFDQFNLLGWKEFHCSILLSNLFKRYSNVLTRLSTNIRKMAGILVTKRKWNQFPFCRHLRLTVHSSISFTAFTSCASLHRFFYHVSLAMKSYSLEVLCRIVLMHPNGIHFHWTIGKFCSFLWSVWKGRARLWLESYSIWVWIHSLRFVVWFILFFSIWNLFRNLFRLYIFPTDCIRSLEVDKLFDWTKYIYQWLYATRSTHL